MGDNTTVHGAIKLVWPPPGEVEAATLSADEQEFIAALEQEI
ncbi:hypothetical protein ACF08N_33905 [Streptomyces sp. NPDC015127]